MKALIFDCDGVLADTERDGHLVAFNQMFTELGLPHYWSEDEYGELIKIAGGKERMASVAPDVPPEEIAIWHKRKTEIYRELIESGAIPGRPGVKRLAAEALKAGWKVAVASTATAESVYSVMVHVFGFQMSTRIKVYAGDVVARKKPHPDIYLYAMQELGVTAEETVIIEDSGIGCQSAVAAGVSPVITISTYSRGDDFTGAKVVLEDLANYRLF